MNKQIIKLKSEDNCIVDLNEDKSFIMLNGVVIDKRTIHRMFVLQHGVGYKYNFKDDDPIFENNGLEDIKKEFCDLYSWMIRANYLLGNDSKKTMPEDIQLLLEFIQQWESSFRELSVPSSFWSCDFKEYENTVRHERI